MSENKAQGFTPLARCGNCGDVLDRVSTNIGRTRCERCMAVYMATGKFPKVDQ